MNHRLTVLIALSTLATASACDVDPSLGHPHAEVYDAYGDGGSPRGLAVSATFIGPAGALEPPPPPVEPTRAEAPTAPTLIVGGAATTAATPTRAGRTATVAPAEVAPAVAEPTRAVKAPTVEPTEVEPTEVEPTEEEPTEVDDAPFDGEVLGTRLYWGPRGKRFGIMQVDFEGGGSGWSDITGKIVRLRDGAVRHQRVIAEADRAEDSEDDIDPRATRRGLKFHNLLTDKRYTLAAEASLSPVDGEADIYDTREAVVDAGPHKGMTFTLEAVGSDRVRIWVKSPGADKRRLLGSGSVPLEECWDAEHPDDAEMWPHAVMSGDQLCHQGEPRLSAVWISPNSAHVVVEVASAPGPGCRADSFSGLVVGRVR